MDGSASGVVRGMEWGALLRRVRALVPEAFTAGGRPLNLIKGEWREPGAPRLVTSPVDGALLGEAPMLDLKTAREGVRSAAGELSRWSRVGLDERRRRVAEAVRRLEEHRELLASLLVWEIGKPYPQALVSVDRCVSGVEWYVENIEPMLQGRRPLGLVSNIASWNYPMSVLMHAVLVQVLSGNVAIAKVPTDGGLFTLTLAMALSRRAGLPVSLLSGAGSELSRALVQSDEVACLSFVGGKNSGREVAASLERSGKRYMLEMEGVNAYGVWRFSDWDRLAQQMRKGFEYAKQRCTAYVRYVVERRLFPRFLDTYLQVVESLSFGHPLVPHQPGGPPPELTFGPLISARAAEELKGRIAEALSHGAVALYEGSLERGRFLSGQDRAAYLAPVALMNVPRHCRLYHSEPFGPVDTIVPVDTLEELVAEMNVSNGALVASIASDEAAEARAIAQELRAFKVGINAMRSRGDNEEAFGGVGSSWKGCFVGGRYLVDAVTVGGSGERLHGNFPDERVFPQGR